MESAVKMEHSNSTSSPNVRIANLVELCYFRTVDALTMSGVASEGDIFQALTKVRDGLAKDQPLDFLETLARVLGTDEERLGGMVHTLSEAVASTFMPAPPSIPFASKLIAPSAFYESFDAIHKLGRALLAPVLYAEDTDSIGTGSVNPIAATILAEEIHVVVFRRFGIRPFMTTARMEYESWAFLCRKHFEL